MITLYGFGPAFGLLDPSPFVTKVEIFLRMNGIEYQKKRGSLGKSPTQKLPYIDDDGTLISDSSLILDYLMQKYAPQFNAHLTDEAHAQGLAFQRLLEDHLYFAALYGRWLDSDYNQPVHQRFLSKIPKLIRPLVKTLVVRRMRGYVHAQGLGRHPKHVIYDFARRDIRALRTFLGEKTWLLGDKPSSYDATVGAFLWSIMRVEIPSPFEDIRAESPNFKAYVDRLAKTYFPEVGEKKDRKKSEPETQPVT
ncbi:MAG: glutathione S-transferase family protein [Acidobacteria bacterium]|nr:glutathione S-transferase family protein [Acidobacteriota bacterium]